MLVDVKLTTNGAGLAGLRPLLAELCDLKRVRAAQTYGRSLAETGFRRAWGDLLAGGATEAVALRETAAAVAATRLGAIDRAVLLDGGLNASEATDVLQDGFDTVAAPIESGLRRRLRAALEEGAVAVQDPPPFVARLEAQPRAGATRPGCARLVLEPPESHADHCMTVASMGVLLAGVYGAEPGTVFLMGLAHHLHNADLPDGGFTGEELLGDHLGPVMRRFTDRALGELPPGLCVRVEAARDHLADVETPEGRAFNAADVSDRVLQMAHYAQSASFELRQALVDLDLVHPGPLQRFHQDVLAAAGIWPC